MMRSFIFFALPKANREGHVSKCYSILRPHFNILSRIKYYLSDDEKPDFETIYPEGQKAIIFGYRAADKPEIETAKNPLRNSWFGQKKKMAVFFIPRGQSLFSYPLWHNQFKEYVSFKHNYEFLVDDLPIIKEMSSKIQHKILSVALNEQSSKKLKDEIVKIYDLTIFDLLQKMQRDRLDSDDILMLIYKLIINRDNIVSS